MERSRARGAVTAAVLILLPVAAVLSSLLIGRLPVTAGDLFSSLAGRLSGAPAVTVIDKTLWNIRLPRILLALLAGAGLSVSGCAYQSLFVNPLATPDTLGVASGASFGAALGLLAGLPLPAVQGLSMVSGTLAVALTFLVGRAAGGRDTSPVILSGIMIGSLFTALVSFVKFTADSETSLPAITYFLMGELGGASYRTLAVGAPMILIGIAVLWLLRWRLNGLSLGVEEARSAGIDLIALRLVTVLCATAITASSVAMCGQVGWVGLLVPHMCRMLVGADHTRLIPASALVGGAFLVIVDTAARSISAASLPVSVLTAFVGAPFFVVLMVKTGRGRV